MVQTASTQLQRVLDALQDGQWKTLAQISAITGDVPKSAGSRIRDLRLPAYGGHDISARQLPSGEWEYRLNTPAAIPAGVGWVIHVAQPAAQVKFINARTLQPEYVDKAKCRVEKMGAFERVVALDDQGKILPHLVTTESSL